MKSKASSVSETEEMAYFMMHRMSFVHITPFLDNRMLIVSSAAVHSRLNDPNICSLLGAGTTSKGVRFIVLERLDGGTLTQRLGYDTRIRDRRRRFWRKKQMAFLEVLRCARSIACAMEYCQDKAIPGSMVLHRDLKPDNIGFTLNGDVKIIDFGLAKIVDNASTTSEDSYEMSGETGSLRYMAPEVADSHPYNHKADVYSFGKEYDSPPILV
jgi:serine/threonine protein kinase